MMAVSPERSHSFHIKSQSIHQMCIMIHNNTQIKSVWPRTRGLPNQTNISLHLPANYPFNLGVFLHLLLPQPSLAVLQSVLVLQQNLIGLLFLREEPPLVLLQLFVRHQQAVLQGVDLVLVLTYLRKNNKKHVQLWRLSVVITTDGKVGYLLLC